jgi:ribA/ribD-fused uncharacterized protein
MYKFFWNGPFSQWHNSQFIIDMESEFEQYQTEFNCCEQWMMFNKAWMFGDKDTAYRIMDTKYPRIQKALGRQVKNFDDNKWMQVAYNIVVHGNMAKFTQNEELLQVLKETCGMELVEASPYDTRWGIGMGENDPGILDSSNWKGENLLGKAITQVRIELFGS